MELSVLSLIIGVIFFIWGVMGRKNIKIYSTLYEGHSRYKHQIVNEIAKSYSRLFIVFGLIIILGTVLSVNVNSGRKELWFLILPILLLFVGISLTSYFIRKKYHSHTAKKRYIIFTIIFLPMVFVPLYVLTEESSITLQKEGVMISGMYGGFIPYNSIKDAELLNETDIPNAHAGVEEFSFNDIKRGHYEIDEWGDVRLFLQTSEGPFLRIISEEGQFLINTSNEEKTVDLFNGIISKIPKFDAIYECTM